MFRQFGYEYVFTPAGKYLRAVIDGRVDQTAFQNAVRDVRPEQWKFPGKIPCIAVVRKPLRRRCFVVYSRASGAAGADRLVCLPGLWEDDKRLYDEMIGSAPDCAAETWTMTCFVNDPAPDLTDKELKYRCRNAWYRAVRAK